MVIKIYRSGNYVLALNNANSAQLFRVLSRNILATNFSGQVRITNILTGQVFSTEAFGDYLKQDNNAYGANITDTITALNTMLGFNAGTGTGGSGGSGGGGGEGSSSPEYTVQPTMPANITFTGRLQIGTASAPVSGNIPAPDLTGAINGGTVRIYHSSTTTPIFNSPLYAQVVGSAYNNSVGAINIVDITNLGGAIEVAINRIQYSTAPNPLTLTGSATLAVGDTVSPANIGQAGTTYQWQTSIDSGNSWQNISGATSSSYTIQAGDAGRQLRVQVVYLLDGMFISTTANSVAKSISLTGTRAAILTAMTVAGATKVFRTTTVDGSLFDAFGANQEMGCLSAGDQDYTILIDLQGTNANADQALVSFSNSGDVNPGIVIKSQGAGNAQKIQVDFYNNAGTLYRSILPNSDYLNNTRRAIIIDYVASTNTVSVFVDNYTTPVSSVVETPPQNMTLNRARFGRTTFSSLICAGIFIGARPTSTQINNFIAGS